MTKLLVELLDAEEPLFSQSLKQLEEVSGKPGVDVKLKAEIIEKFHAKLKALGLDHQDSTGEEIYSSLINRVRKDDKRLAKKIGAEDPEDVESIIPLVVDCVNRADMKRQCWALKDDVAKDMLRNMPPQKVMERLGFSSVDEMLDKKDLYEIYGALRFAEDSDWLNKFNAQYEKLKSEDFEDREIRLVVIPKHCWGDLAADFVDKKKHLSTHLKELGVVYILPSTIDKIPGITTKLLTLTFHYFSEVRMYSAFFKLRRDKPDFGRIFVETLIADPGGQAVLAGNKIHWRVIQRYFNKLGEEHHPEMFQPHVHPEDLDWRKAEEIIYEIDPEMAFWKDLDYIGMMYDGRPVTMNLIDISLSYSNGINYEDRYTYHFNESLWNEVFMRYMGHKALENQILKQLDNDVIKPEVL